MTDTKTTPRWECPCGMQHSQAAKYCSECGRPRPAPVAMSEEAIGSALAWEWINAAGTTSDRRIAVARKARSLLAPKLPSKAQATTPTVTPALDALIHRAYVAGVNLPAVEVRAAYAADLAADTASLRHTIGTRDAQIGDLKNAVALTVKERDAEKERADRAEAAVRGWVNAVEEINGCPSAVNLDDIKNPLCREVVKELRLRAATIARLQGELANERAENDGRRASHARPELPALEEEFLRLGNGPHALILRVRSYQVRGEPGFWDSCGRWYALADEGKTWRRVAPEAKAQKCPGCEHDAHEGRVCVESVSLEGIGPDGHIYVPCDCGKAQKPTTPPPPDGGKPCSHNRVGACVDCGTDKPPGAPVNNPKKCSRVGAICPYLNDNSVDCNTCPEPPAPPSRLSIFHGEVWINPHRMGGQPCIAGTRITVSTIKSVHRDGWDTERICREYPTLVPADVEAALAWTGEELPAPVEGTGVVTTPTVPELKMENLATWVSAWPQSVDVRHWDLLKRSYRLDAKDHAEAAVAPWRERAETMAREHEGVLLALGGDARNRSEPLGDLVAKRIASLDADLAETEQGRTALRRFLDHFLDGPLVRELGKTETHKAAEVAIKRITGERDANAQAARDLGRLRELDKLIRQPLSDSDKERYADKIEDAIQERDRLLAGEGGTPTPEPPKL